MSDVTFEPALYYEVTARDDNESCRNYGVTFTVAEFYSNGAVDCHVTCGVCRQRMTILTATLLDPQPEVS